MLTSHSSWGEWFPPGLGGLTYLTAHIFTMVVSALLWGQRSEFQTSWVITDFTGFSAHPLPARSTNPSHELLFVAPPSLLWFFLDPFWLQVKKLSWWMQRFHPCCHFCCRFKSDQIILGGGFSDQRIKSLISSFKSTNLPHWLQVSVESFTSCSIHQVSVPKTCPSPSVPCNLNLVSHQRLAGLTLAKTPACGSMVYFLWMKDPNESAFLPRLWKETAGCLVSSCQASVFDIHRRVKQYTTEGKAKMKHMVKKNINKGPRGWCAVEILQH